MRAARACCPVTELDPIPAEVRPKPLHVRCADDFGTSWPLTQNRCQSMCGMSVIVRAVADLGLGRITTVRACLSGEASKNRLVTGVLGYACLGSCVFRLTSLLACETAQSRAQASPATRIGESAFQRTRTEVQGAVCFSVRYAHIPTHKHTHTRERQGSAFGVPANGREGSERARGVNGHVDW